MSEDPTVREVWESLSDDVRESVYVCTDALIKQQRAKEDLRSKMQTLSENQKTVIFYLLGEAMECRMRPIDAGKNFLLVKDEWL